jgi:hypothetical protein
VPTITSDLTPVQADILADLTFAYDDIAATPAARALARRGILETTTDDPGRYRLTVDGALLALAALAGWDIPADSGDPYVVDLCARSALGTAEAHGAHPTMARTVIDRLLTDAGLKPLDPNATPYRGESR